MLVVIAVLLGLILITMVFGQNAGATALTAAVLLGFGWAVIALLGPFILVGVIAAWHYVSSDEGRWLAVIGVLFVLGVISSKIRK